MTVSDLRRESIGEEKEALKVADWLHKCEKTLDFIFNNDPDDLTDEEAACADNERGQVGNSGLRGKPRRLVVKPKEGDVLVGRWVKGAREGQGTVSTLNLEEVGVKAIMGNYVLGRLEGQAKMVMADGSCRHCWAQRGWLHGPCRGVLQEGDQKLVYLGHYAAGAPAGVCWTATKGGGWLVGSQNCKGEYTGDHIAFLYPDLSTALVGKFSKDQTFSYWPSTIDRVLCPPHQRDPYESKFVRTGPSKMEGGGEGLFAKRFIASDTIVAFYNGVRIGSEEANPHGNTGYCIFVDWGKELPFPFPWVKDGDQIDIPAKYQASEDYTATLAHKVNHSFSTNCEFTNFSHPCYGLLPAIITTRDILKDEELFTNYSLDMKVLLLSFLP